MAALEVTASNLLASSLSESTLKSYNATLNEFRSFVISLGPYYQSPKPNIGHVILFISHLFNKGLSAQTITTKMSAITYYFKLQSLPDPMSNFLVIKCLTGVRKLSPTLDQRLPITIPILEKLMALTFGNLKSHFHSLLVRTMFSLSFYAFLRPGEITKSPHNLSLDQISFSPSHISIKFLSFKHHSGRAVTIQIPKQPGPSCPVQSLSQYLQLRGNSPGPLFCYPNQDPVTYNSYHEWFHHLLDLSRIPGKFNTHSFRIGAATWAASRGVSSTLIQQMGRWRSSAYLKYIRMPLVHI